MHLSVDVKGSAGACYNHASHCGAIQLGEAPYSKQSCSASHGFGGRLEVDGAPPKAGKVKGGRLVPAVLIAAQLLR